MTCNCMGCPHPTNCRCRCETCAKEAASLAPSTSFTPAPGDAEALEWAERFLAAGARGANGEAGQIIRRLLAESRRLAGEVADWKLAFETSNEHVGQLAGEVAQLQQQVAALTPPDIDEDACSFAVLAARMSRDGYSYDAKEGIWWKDDSRPGILDAAIKRAEAAEGKIARLREQIQGI